jgi:fructose-bisphosphate aldolase class II
LCGIGSGARDKDFRQAIKAGMIIVHVNTEMCPHGAAASRMRCKRIRKIAPYEILPAAVQPMSEVVEKRLRLFNFF